MCLCGTLLFLNFAPVRVDTVSSHVSRLLGLTNSIELDLAFEWREHLAFGGQEHLALDGRKRLDFEPLRSALAFGYWTKYLVLEYLAPSLYHIQLLQG